MSNKTKNLDPTLKEKIRNLFVQGQEETNGARVLYTIKQLAEAHEVGESTLYRHSQAENWKEQQERFQAEYLLQLDAARKTELVKDSKKFDTSTLNIAKALLGQIGQSMQKLQTQDKVTPSTLNTLAEATYKVQRVAKLALGEATDNMSLNAKITDSTAFREAMELLDSVAEQRRESNDSSVH